MMQPATAEPSRAGILVLVVLMSLFWSLAGYCVGRSVQAVRDGADLVSSEVR